ncbi:hypothetical protein SAMN05216522_10948 [Rosenbergiella nectarea]|uniref:Alpha/beta hydrolase n=2 Tax=Rosenbergiella nectarea TaxID=988801 RepID=A0A1H9KBP3_9GAMM|nr:hypothetical protein SAMN05216522_10948 [Rosenbergiella nectarea]
MGYFKKSIVLVFFILVHLPGSFARPNMAPLGPSIADTGSQYYTFRVIKLASIDAQRHYKVWVAVPKKKAPAQGYPILYLLDGNSSLSRLSETLLKEISDKRPPVLVFIGYNTPLPFDLKARTYDYTPLATEGSANGSPMGRGRVGGGSTVFRSLLEQKIIPLSEGSLPINSAQRALWGHSYGGLFVIDSYLHASRFTHFFSASPSLSQGYRSMLAEMARNTVNSKSMLFMEGEDKVENIPHPHIVSLSESVKQLAQRGLNISIKTYPGLSHGEMFGTSLVETIRLNSE